MFESSTRGCDKLWKVPCGTDSIISQLQLIEWKKKRYR